MDRPGGLSYGRPKCWIVRQGRGIRRQRAQRDDSMGYRRDSQQAAVAFCNRLGAVANIDTRICMIRQQIQEQITTPIGTPDAFIEDRKAVNVMTVLLVLGTFLVFIVLDYALNRRKAIQMVSAEAHSAVSRFGADYVDGFLVPQSVSYHSGHSWLVRERQNVVRVGADEFAAALMGKIEKIELPKPGQWVRQGQKVISFFRDGQKTEMVSPTEGEIMAINTEVLQNPTLLRQDPYGKGWLVSVH